MIRFFNNTNDFLLYDFEKVFFDNKDFIKITVIDNTHKKMLPIYKQYSKDIIAYLETFKLLEPFPLVVSYNGKNFRFDINF